ncbi:MAG: hypothetical protein JXA71_07765 [Chitinispirillaceae bacterium]|nr:hypothetical protein [Chitinispirillaceae bacterium]
MRKNGCYATLLKLFYSLGLLFLLPNLSFGYTWNTMQLNSIRIAYIHTGNQKYGDGSLDDFMVRAKNNHYNYIMGTFYLTAGDNNTYAVLKNNIKTAFQKADAFGLRLIPTINLGSPYSLHWNEAKAWNPNIKMLRVNLVGGGEFGGPSFTYDPLGIDKTFPEVLLAIKEAYESAHVSYPFEFLHLGHDEPASYTYLLMGDCKTGGSSSLYCTNPMPFNVDAVYEVCQPDKDFINNFTGTKTEAVQTLLVTEIFRRLNQIAYSHEKDR